MALFDFFRTGARAAALDIGAPRAQARVAETEFLAVDMETTGLNPKAHDIVSIGWVPVRGNQIVLKEAGYVLIKGVEVGESATIHHLTDEDLAAGISLETAVDQVLVALQNRVLLAHFAPIETQFLKHACRKIKGQPPCLQVVDTFALERRHMERMGTYPRGEDLRLPRVRQRYGLPMYGNHNALTDAIACAELFLALKALGKPETIKDLQPS